MYSTSAFIFRRDLRVYDNTALNEALRLSGQVIPCFVFEPHQTASPFLLQSIADLQQQLKSVEGNLSLFRGLPEEALKKLVEDSHIQAVFLTRDYTPLSRQGDERLAAACKKLGIQFHSLPGLLLNEPEQALKSDQTPYKMFTPFYNNARKIPVPKPQAPEKYNFLAVPSQSTRAPLEFAPSPELASKGGRSQALAILRSLGENCADYENTRDFPALAATSQLSAHLNFGTCSVREVFHAIKAQLGKDHPLLRQLYWRDFFTHVAYHFPQVFQQAFLEKFVSLRWDNNPEYFQAWCEGKTGFPIVDAGMRELNATGFMQNRVRMITASFLVKDLHIDWRWGERYFAQKLVDYDPCVNNGNWQWAASTGCDAQPYFRIFNPWLQQKKFDQDCEYIYRWVPELKEFPPKIIHQWFKKHSPCAYPPPLVDHARESHLALIQYKSQARS